VFPSFLFAVGNAMSFSIDRYRLQGNRPFLSKVIRRTLLIFLLGYLMYWFPFFRLDHAHHIVGAPISHTRIMGVLQRIALCYFFASLLIHFLSSKAVTIISILLLVGYWILLLLFGDSSQPYSILGNAGLYLDKFLMGNDHLYHGEGIPFDPEGWLSTLPAIVNVIIGYRAGKYIQRNGKNESTISHLLLIGLLLVFIALCWNMAFPINKKLWTSSFVLLTSGIDLCIIGSLLYMIEIKRRSREGWVRFFEIPGKNPLFIYLLSELMVTILFMIPVGNDSLFDAINSAVFQPLAPGPVGSLLFALCYMMFCWFIAWVLDKNRVYVRV
jgi:predicted acyltransferase